MQSRLTLLEQCVVFLEMWGREICLIFFYIIFVIEMSMLRWMCRKTKTNKIRNDNISESVRATHIVEKMMKIDLGGLDM